jgi:hypothetical protein
LGKPDSDLTGGGFSATCILADSYFAAVNTATGAALTSNDGLVIQSSLLPSGDLPPCIKVASANVPTVTVGGVAATVLYAGWVADSIAGLYQINVQMPISSATFTDASGVTGPLPPAGTNLHLPIVIQGPTGKFSQPTGVNLFVAPRLKVVATGQTTGAVTVLWTGSQITATEGTAAYTYAVTTGTLPVGLAIDANTGAITGTPTTAGTSGCRRSRSPAICRPG